MGHHALSRNGPLAALVLAAATIVPTGIASAAPTTPAASAAPALPRAQADFDGDGHDDLAIGAPYEAVGTVSGAGAVNVFYATASSGLARTSQMFTQNMAGIGSDPEPFDRFGFSLAVGDFDGDGYDDLAIGAPGESVGSLEGAGAVQVLYGSATGLGTAGSQLFTQANVGVGRGAAPYDDFGAALAAVDLGSTTASELVIGAPFAGVGTAPAAGLVNVLYGAAAGLTTGRVTQVITQGTAGVGSDPEPYDNFGATLAGGNTNGGTSDVAVGAPGESVGALDDAGTVHLLFGTPTGLTGTGSAMFHQDVVAIGSDAEAYDVFGATIAMGDFDGDGFDDVAVGAVGESVGTIESAGAVNVIYAGPGGLNTGRASQLFTQGTAGIGSDPEALDSFGSALAAGDFDGDGAEDLVVGVPEEAVGNVDNAGVVHAVYGVTGGFLNAGRVSQMLTEDTPGVQGTVAPHALFGLDLAAAGFDGDGLADLVVGVPGEAFESLEDAGSVRVLHGVTAGLSGAGSEQLVQGYEGVGSAPEAGDFFGAAIGVAAS